MVGWGVFWCPGVVGIPLRSLRWHPFNSPSERGRERDRFAKGREGSLMWPCLHCPSGYPPARV